MDEIYINFKNFIETHPQPIKSIVGGEGIGKTYGLKTFCIKKFIETGKKTIFLFRYASDFENDYFEGFIKDLPEEMQEKITFEKDCILYEKNPCIYIRILNRYINGKGRAYNDVDLLAFDEFIIPKNKRYLPDEILAFKRWVQSVFRLRKINVILLANSLRFVNPYFEYFKVKKEENKDFFENEKIFVWFAKATKAFKEKAKKSDYYKVFDDEQTKRFSLDGEFYFDSQTLICSKPENALPMYKFKVEKTDYILFNCDEFCFIAKPKRKYNGLPYFALLKQDVDFNSPFNKNISQILLQWYLNGQIYFENLSTKTNFLRGLNVQI